MTQLTKEHFEQQLGKLATKTDLDNLEAHIDSEALVIRQELKQGFQSVDIKLEAIYKMLDVRKRVEYLEREVERLKKAPRGGVRLPSSL